MKFSQLAKLFEELEKTSSYNEMKKKLAAFFKKTPKQEIKQTTYLLLGTIDSHYSDTNIGMADKMVIKAIAKSGKQKEEKILAEYKKQGDIGKTAEKYSGNGNLTVTQVFDTLHSIAKTSGKGSQEQKIKQLADLLSKANAIQAKYIARIVIGDLRLGVGDKTILDSLILAYEGKREDIDYAYHVCPDAGQIAETIAAKGIKAVKKIGVKLGTPIQSMLCQRVKSLDEIKNKLGYPVAVEEKYDGERIQIHKKGNAITLYSRRLENITLQYPDLIHQLKKSVNAKNCIIDSEVMPVDEKGNLLKFQLLMQRRRKHSVEEYSKKIPVVLFAFDILYLNKSLIQLPYEKRYDLLRKTIKETGKVKLALRKICDDMDCIEELFNKTIQHGGEGIVIKSLKGTYEAGIRGWNWVKWKPEYVKGLRDTFDLIIVGAYYGKGRRTGSYGALLCAVYDSKTNTYKTFCKLGSGFTDETLAKLPKILKKTNTKPVNAEVSNAMKPDVWIIPEKVVEVTGAEITKSPNHTAGYALRFPRFLKWREKTPEQATTLKEILKLI